VQVGANIFRAAGVDLARVWNAAFPDASVSMPGVGGAVSAVGAGESAADIAVHGPSVQNVGGLTVGLANTWKNITDLVGLTTETASDATDAAGAVASSAGAVGEAIPVIGLGIGAFNLSQNPSPGAAVGVGVAGAEIGAQLGATAGFEGLAGASSVLGPAGLVLSAPFIIGGIFHTIARWTGLTHAAFHPPAGYMEITVPGYDSAAVDPSTGRILLYHDGHYTWSEQTLNGEPATPDQLRAWGVQPTGQLALQPGYRDLPKVRDSWVMAMLQGILPSNRPVVAGTPAQLTQSYLMDQRAPTIQAIHKAHPDESPGTVWRDYTLTPEYQQEQAIAAALDPGPIEHGGGGQ
jgi:hypothetical protein